MLMTTRYFVNFYSLQYTLVQKKPVIQMMFFPYDFRISELEGKLDQTEKATKRMQEDFARRYGTYVDLKQVSGL